MLPSVMAAPWNISMGWVGLACWPVKLSFEKSKVISLCTASTYSWAAVQRARLDSRRSGSLTCRYLFKRTSPSSIAFRTNQTAPYQVQSQKSDLCRWSG